MRGRRGVGVAGVMAETCESCDDGTGREMDWRCRERRSRLQSHVHGFGVAEHPMLRSSVVFSIRYIHQRIRHIIQCNAMHDVRCVPPRLEKKPDISSLSLFLALSLSLTLSLSLADSLSLSLSR